MIPLETVLWLLDKLEKEGLALIRTPQERDSFEYGKAHGIIRSADLVREWLNQIVEEQAQGEREQ